MIQGCEVCEDNPSKYKCTKCNIPFCSVACGKTHKDSTACLSNDQTSNDDNKTNNPDQSSNEWHTENTVPQELLNKLGESSKLCELLKNKDLQNILKLVDKSSNVQDVYSEAMKDAAFEEFVQICLSIVQPESTE